jgi:hypothetical protein
MTNASTAGGGGHERPDDAEPFFPSEGSFNAVVPLSEVARAPAVRGGGPDAGQPAEAAWARAARRAEAKEEEETTLVPARDARARGRGSAWGLTAVALVLSVAAGVAAGAYLVWSAQPTAAPAVEANAATQTAPQPETQTATATTETPAVEANAEKSNAIVEDEKTADEKAAEVFKGKRSSEVARAPKEANEAKTRATEPAPSRAERPARPASEERETAAKPAPRQSNAAPRARVTAASKPPHTASTSARALPISTPPPSAKSKKVIQWP